jgi:diguanylate cyclase
MHYSENIHKAGEFLRLALVHMARHNLPVDPVNYSVWYEYVAGKNQMLSKTIDEFLTQAKPISVELNKYLYQRFIADEMAALSEKMLKELRKVIHDMSKHVKNSGVDFDQHGEVLERYASRLANPNDYEQFTKIINAIAQETRALVKTSRTIKNNLDQVQKELDILKIKLQTTREEATTDSLTGLANRRGFEQVLVQEIETAANRETPLSLLMIDIDHFKAINDNFGHLAGDSVLKIIANTIRDYTKRRDSVFRYGGEEFVVILPETPLEGAVIVGEKIRKFLESMNWKNKASGASMGTITLSVGAAIYRPGESADTFFQRADQSLYYSKNNGRNRVTPETSVTAK